MNDQTGYGRLGAAMSAEAAKRDAERARQADPVGLRLALTPLRGYPTDGVSHDRHWVRDPNGAYLGFEDVMDALASLPAQPVEPERDDAAYIRSKGRWLESAQPVEPPAHLDAYMNHPEGYREGWAAAMALVRQHDAQAVEPGPLDVAQDALRAMLFAVPVGLMEGADRYDTDDKHVLHVWRDGHSWDIEVPRVRFSPDKQPKGAG